MIVAGRKVTLETILATLPAIGATPDSVVLDRCGRWVNAARAISAARVRNAFIVLRR